MCVLVSLGMCLKEEELLWLSAFCLDFASAAVNRT